MTSEFSYQLVSPQTGNLAFKLFSLKEDNSDFNYIQRLGYFTLIFLEEGGGQIKADFNEFTFDSTTFLSFSPYQPFVIEARGTIKGSCIFFHPEFFCIYNHIKDVACNGVLFENAYKPPLTNLDAAQKSYLKTLIEQMKGELPLANFAQADMLISLLRIAMIYVSRIKLEQNVELKAELTDDEPFVLQNLKTAIESNFKAKHAASDYAEMLNVSVTALAKICKKYYQKTLTNLISERIMVEAKRELYLTSKTIKEIAVGLGYEDEYYFSRFFKKNAEVSPSLYRETIGFRISA